MAVLFMAILLFFFMAVFVHAYFCFSMAVVVNFVKNAAKVLLFFELDKCFSMFYGRKVRTIMPISSDSQHITFLQ